MRQVAIVALLIAVSFIVSERSSMSQDQPGEHVTPPIQSPSDVSIPLPTGERQDQPGEHVTPPIQSPSDVSIPPPTGESQGQPGEHVTPPMQSPSDVSVPPPTGRSREQHSEPLATPTNQPAGTPDQGAQPKTDTAPQGPKDHGLRRSFKIQLTYSEKLAVPPGSNLSVTITDAGGHKVTELKSVTKKDSPPYLLEIPIKKRMAYPLTLDAELASRIGHRFSERTTIDERSVQGDAPIEIHLQKK
jgi:hypothetical protein